MPHRTIDPSILYWGTPVALITTISPDGTENIGPMSSAWALGHTVVMGWERTAQTCDNLDRTRECVVNVPDPELADEVELLAPLTGRNPPAPEKAHLFRYEADKFAAANLTRVPSDTVAPPRIAECPLQLEAKIATVHPPVGPDGEHFQIFEAHVERVHAEERIVKPGTEHIDTSRWSPLLYVFRHYFGTGEELGKTYRAED